MLEYKSQKTKNTITDHWKFDKIFDQNSKIGSFFKQRAISSPVKDDKFKHNELIRKNKDFSYKGKISCSIGHHANISQTLILELASLGMQRPVIAPFPIGKDCPLTQLCDEPHNAPYTSGSCEGIYQSFLKIITHIIVSDKASSILHYRLLSFDWV